METITITVNQAWVIRELLKNVASNMDIHCNKNFVNHFEPAVMDCHNWLEHEMIKQLKGE